jgi:hypothetical protein
MVGGGGLIVSLATRAQRGSLENPMVHLSYKQPYLDVDEGPKVHDFERAFEVVLITSTISVGASLRSSC